MSTNELINVLEDTAALLQKTQVNIKKCPKSRLTKGYVEARIKCIEEYWTTFRDTHQQLVKITSKEQKQKLNHFVNEDYDTYEDLYLVLLADLQDLLSTISASSLPTTSKNNSFANTNNDQLVRLPRIQLPSFSGNYEDWPTFQDLFISLVHENTAISDVQKLHYLKSSVTGEAEILLKPIQITQSNYEQAWSVLKSRYGNKRLIINSVLKKLFSQRKINNQSANQIKSLLDVTTDCLNNLQNLNIITSTWDPIIIFIVIQKMDPETHKEWEQSVCSNEDDKLPTWDDLKQFLQSRYRTIELVMSTSGTREKPIKERSHLVTATATTSPSSGDRKCVLCKENHTLCHCKDFTKLQPAERSEYVKSNKLCFNCLVPGHSAYQCKLRMNCRICSRRHHTLLHRPKDSASSVQSEDFKQPKAIQHGVEQKEEIVNTTITSHHSAKQSTSLALLATATVSARNEHNHTVVLRALVDQGSQASFISEKATQLLKLTRHTARGSIIGVGSTRTNVDHVVQLRIGSRWNPSFEINIQAYVMSKQLTTKIPSKAVPVTHWPHLEGLNLADPDYYKPGPIDLLLGVKEYAQLVQQQLIKGPPGSPCAQETNLGWILFGEINTSLQEESFLVLHQQIEIENMLKSLWEIDTDKKRKLTREENLCETIYESTHARTEEGRYIVRLPFKTENPLSPIGNTKEIARNRLLQLERRFRKEPILKEDYKKAMQEYIKSNYMEEIPENELNKTKAVYLPHHAVVRADKETSKTRVVFDASAKGLNHVSLNDELLVGPQLQDDLRDIVMRSRLYRVCYASDIQKMYLQVLLHKQDADTYQRLLWREEASDPLKEYRMLRVTFGTASAPYLAVRTLHQVADDEGENHPEATRVIKSDFYMDDVISGEDTAEKAIQTAQEVSQILQRGGFILSKWSSNSTEFMQAIDANKRTTRVHLDLKLDGTVQALGLIWNLGTDQFQYKINLPSMSDKVTKRTILSDMQKLFDPLGWIAPSLILAKILIQKLWMEKVSWDDKINENLVDEWLTIREDFEEVKEVKIDRWLGTLRSEVDKIEIHGFSDASTRAYAAVAYVRIKMQDGSVSTKLQAAKTRVAPLRTVSLPRLELCGALLLSRLLKQIQQAMRIPTSNIYAWTDSTIVLAWLSGDPHKWKTFVANRVVEIAENVNNNRWFHVSSEDNPADIGSRGMLLVDLKKSDLWWKGPAWLSETEIRLKQECAATELESKKDKIQANLKMDIEEGLKSQFKEFANLQELIKVITYCRRFLNFKRSLENTEKDFTTKELERSLLKCIELVQQEEFKEDIERLKSNKALKGESKIKTLNPYLDGDGILRVGGRLRNANLEEQVKHPIIIGNKNYLVPLIIADAHARTLHGGVQLMLNYISSKYWVVRSKALIKACIHKCLICARFRSQSRTQIMGDLPKARVTPARAFLHSGVDFAGPFHITMSKGRGIRTQKAYICVFICMSTKAMHLELVSDLTSEAFIAAFKRFVARRGKCSDLWSDQGRNFVGANKELINAWKEGNLVFEGKISNTLALEGTQWHYIPAYSPNFGGLWEAGVKSVKHHLKRVLTTNLTYEEMTTVLCQIEACLNSRPLCPIDDKDSDCIEVLTPGHFLIGETPIVVPSPDFKDAKMHSLSRWQYTQKLLGDFWRRWQQEYLTRLQQRPIWLKKSEEFKVGDVVLIKTDGLPPGKFSLGRVVDKHPGGDGITRVYSIKSGNSIVKRSCSKLCPLPIATE
ncbi:uncharacterized protein LOC113508909 [Trichoplusia ni]|uniref:Uncharacterized protein LOC113508909 n=1 Tax=Trichoplusia ni TaxID=7111 RepID=A0A7E5X3V5_TRINI|nr:uncharacterized protein LOC113508909 [Trichoplusia ni]